MSGHTNSKVHSARTGEPFHLQMFVNMYNLDTGQGAPDATATLLCKPPAISRGLGKTAYDHDPIV